MKIHACANFTQVSQMAFSIVKMEIDRKPDLLFCVASGGSPSGLYAEMAKEKERDPSFCNHLKVIKLDEWGGLEPGSTFSSEYDVQQKFIIPLGIPSERYWTIDPTTPDPKKACQEMEQILEQHGPLDVCILGIGVNGHIALNEPASYLRPNFHVCELAESTLNNGMIKSLSQPPTFGMTMGMGDILKAKKILLLLAGSGKKEAFQKLMTREITTQLPASFLWTHPNVDLIVDESAV